MAYRVRPCRSLDELGRGLAAIGHYFGWTPAEEEVERFSHLLPVERMHVAFDGKEIVGGAGVFPFEMTVPGGVAPCAGVTVVGVLPTHRRRGLLSRMMRAQLDDVHERGEPFAALWASEPTIYGRFGYGHASHTHSLRLPRVRATLHAGAVPRAGEVRLVETAEALKTLPRIYDRVRTSAPGFLSRSREWWELRRLRDDPTRRPPGVGPLNTALLMLDGRPAGYALYRIAQSETNGDWQRDLRVVEALGVDATATRDIWRFLSEIDWIDEIVASLLPTDHATRHLFAHFDHLDLRVGAGLWVNIVDVEAALSARGYRGDGRVTFTIDHSFCPWSSGTWTVTGGVAKRSNRRPDLRLGATALGAAYLGGISFAELAQAGLVEEASRGGIARADLLFGWNRAPWCPEIF